MSDLERAALVAWAAGFIDGEGCIRLANHGGGYARRKHAGQLTIFFTVDQVLPEPLLRLQQLFGGHLYTRKRSNPNHADTWIWRLNGRQAYTALLEMEPYFTNKKPHVQVLREFMKNVRPGMTYGPPGMPQEEIDRRVVLKEAMAVLNRRGPRDA